METVTFKGSKDGVSMVLDCHGDFEGLCQIIVQKLWQARDFLGDHTELIINSKDYVLNDGEKLALKILLQSLGHDVLRFVSNPQVLSPKEEAEPLEDLPEEANDEFSMDQFSGLETYFSQGSTLIVRKNIRSGQKIAFDGTLIIFGDVNAGAELKATGHILILGAMRGVAHAGCNNDRNAIIYGTKLLPIQLRIADLIARAPDDEEMETTEAEIVRIIDNHLVIERCLDN